MSKKQIRWWLTCGRLQCYVILEQKLHHSLFQGTFCKLFHSSFEGLDIFLCKAIRGRMICHRGYVFHAIGFDKGTKLLTWKGRSVVSNLKSQVDPTMKMSSSSCWLLQQMWLWMWCTLPSICSGRQWVLDTFSKKWTHKICMYLSPGWLWPFP